ncbi:hypothetical protein E2C01_059213 [Portunus trituberculatus]|uniref:Uncharacterized protein n=1 Tax=Portunus trituberculatus TaxID=210409 RepID=A0A5B7H6Y7_PORTR|nr:hypothetical protein [Portunus trituberculatus]
MFVSPYPKTSGRGSDHLSVTGNNDCKIMSKRFNLQTKHFKPFTSKTRFNIHSVYYLLILYSFRNVCGDSNSEDCGH